jgi:hypothetical protein
LQQCSCGDKRNSRGSIFECSRDGRGIPVGREHTKKFHRGSPRLWRSSGEPAVQEFQDWRSKYLYLLTIRTAKPSGESTSYLEDMACVAFWD